MNGVFHEELQQTSHNCEEEENESKYNYRANEAFGTLISIFVVVIYVFN